MTHAEHNYNVCNFLAQSDVDANDWIVTTAFYSVLHYCENSLFPADYYVDSNAKEINHYSSFEDFVQSFRNSFPNRRNASPHKVRRWLIENQVDEISFEYCALADNCFMARYNNYRISEEGKEEAIRFLNFIKEYCD